MHFRQHFSTLERNTRVGRGRVSALVLIVQGSILSTINKVMIKNHKIDSRNAGAPDDYLFRDAAFGVFFSLDALLPPLTAGRVWWTHEQIVTAHSWVPNRALRTKQTPKVGERIKYFCSLKRAVVYFVFYQMYLVSTMLLDKSQKILL